MKKIIGLTGLAGAGKNTVAEIIEKYDNSYISVSFASRVKDICAVAFGWKRELLEGDTKESREFRETRDEFWSKELGYNFTPRIAMQKIGTELFRNNIDQNFWVICLKKLLTESDKNIIITDVRFKNEIDMIKSLGGEIIRIERNNKPSYWDKAVEYNTNGGNMPEELKAVHPSEWDWIGYDNPSVIIGNYGSIEDLEKVVKGLIIDGDANE